MMAQQPDNLMLLMMMVLPVATDVLLPVLKEFGFKQDQSGLMDFMKSCIAHKGDDEIMDLGKKMRETIVPPSLHKVVESLLGAASGSM